MFNDPNELVKTQKQMAEMLEGEERVFRGYIIMSNYQGTGRFLAKDLEDLEGPNKQIDPRTLQWLIIRNHRFVLK